MPTTILDGETYESALHRRCTEEAAFIKQYEDDGLWPCMNNACDNRVESDGDFCEKCQADIDYYAADAAEDWERT